MGKLLPIILILLGVGGGVGAGLMLRPVADSDMAADAGHAAAVADDGHGATDDQAAPKDSHADDSPASAGDGHGGGYSAEIEYVALRRQLIVPLVDGNRVGSLIVLSLSIEATGGNIEVIYDREPKLRDEFLQVLFRHANTGGFEGVFTSGEAMKDLKASLNAASYSVLGEISHQVLVTEILRQEI